jgi:hypothetical protein
VISKLVYTVWNNRIRCLAAKDSQQNEEYMKKLYMEATLQVEDNQEHYDYFYVTYNKNKLKGPQGHNTQNYNIQAWATIPITMYEVVDMTLFTGKDNKMKSFTMQYRDNQAHLNIRSDYGHGPHDPHFDIEIRDTNGKKVHDIDVKQDENFINYEVAMNAVFMQVEKYNPLIGAKYWLSPAGIYDDRILYLAELRRKYKLSTSITILARAINIRLYEVSRTDYITEEHYKSLVQSVLLDCIQKEREYGGSLEIVGVCYSTPMAIPPFFVFQPEGALSRFVRYFSNGTHVPLEPKGAVFEVKDGKKIIRDLDKTEKSFYAHSEEH